MTEEACILRQCRRPNNYGTLYKGPSSTENMARLNCIDYTVQSGDTLTSIAVKHDVSVSPLVFERPKKYRISELPLVMRVTFRLSTF